MSCPLSGMRHHGGGHLGYRRSRQQSHSQQTAGRCPSPRVAFPRAPRNKAISSLHIRSRRHLEDDRAGHGGRSIRVDRTLPRENPPVKFYTLPVSGATPRGGSRRSWRSPRCQFAFGHGFRVVGVAADSAAALRAGRFTTSRTRRAPTAQSRTQGPPFASLAPAPR